MSDWREELKQIVTDYNEKKQQINTALRTVLKELEVSPYSFRVIVQESQNDRLVWNVELSGHGVKLKFQVNAAEVLEFVTDDLGQVIGGRIPDNIIDKVKSIITRKVKDELRIV